MYRKQNKRPLHNACSGRCFFRKASAQTDPHAFCNGEELAALGDIAGLTGDILQTVGDDVVVHELSLIHI